MNSVYLDLAVDFAQEDVKGYAEIMVIVASADGALVKEELAIIEALMGRCMMHPEMRVDVRNLLEKPPSLELVISQLQPFKMQKIQLQRLMEKIKQLFIEIGLGCWCSKEGTFSLI